MAIYQSSCSSFLWKIKGLTGLYCATGHAAFPGGKADSLEETPCMPTLPPSLPNQRYSPPS